MFRNTKPKLSDISNILCLIISFVLLVALMPRISLILTANKMFLNIKTVYANYILLGIRFICGIYIPFSGLEFATVIYIKLVKIRNIYTVHIQRSSIEYTNGIHIQLSKVNLLLLFTSTNTINIFFDYFL